MRKRDYREEHREENDEYEVDEYAPPSFSEAMRNFRRFLGKTILFVLLIAALLGWALYGYIFADYQSVDFTEDKTALGVSDDALKGLHHIAVFGIDVTDGVGRSDCTMILSIDSKNKQLKVTSLLRDSYVPIKNHGKDKLNHAYAYGGAELMLHTINANFDMDIKEYVVLDFDDVAMLVDAIGGLDMEVSEAERKELNKFIDEGHQPLFESGQVHLDGAQVTAYGRIRYIDNEIFRTGRQRQVLQATLNKLKHINYLKYPKLIREFLPQIETSLEQKELLGFMVRALGCDWTVKEYVLPSEKDDAIGGSYAGYWCWRFDIDEAAENWHEFLKEKIE